MKKDKKKIESKIELPDGITCTLDGDMLNLKGLKGESKRKLVNPGIKVGIKGNEILIQALKNTKREKKFIGSLNSHIKNMIKGVSENHKYILKICSGHFPMNVAVSGNELIIKNFLGEKTPRVLKIKDGVNVKVEGDKINVESADKEFAGQVSADIEELTKRANYDTRIFQDGIYIINKDGKEVN